MLDLYIGYDEHRLVPELCNLTTFQSPFGMLCLVTLPMGWMNSVLIFHDNVTFILQPEIPNTTVPYIDDVLICGPAERYILPDGTEECIPDNPASSTSFGSISKGLIASYSGPSTAAGHIAVPKQFYVWKK
jgi:hypothetical protein